MLGAGIPTTTQTNVTESVSFTVSVKFSGGNKYVGSTAGEVNNSFVIYVDYIMM